MPLGLITNEKKRVTVMHVLLAGVAVKRMRMNIKRTAIVPMMVDLVAVAGIRVQMLRLIAILTACAVVRMLRIGAGGVITAVAVNVLLKRAVNATAVAV